MSAIDRSTPWRQGDLLSAEAIAALCPDGFASEDDEVAVVISHHCDILQDDSKEPDLELVSGKIIRRMGKEANAKIARRLHIEYESEDGSLFLELVATSKVRIPKVGFQNFTPSNRAKLDSRGLKILRTWLASRYSREAFPEKFDQLLNAKKRSKDKSIRERIAEILEPPGDKIRMVLFNLDDGAMNERDTSEGPYELEITVVYESSLEGAKEAGAGVAEAVEALFVETYADTDGKDQGIKLRFCEEVSDEVMTVARRARLIELNLDYMSLEE